MNEVFAGDNIFRACLSIFDEKLWLRRLLNGHVYKIACGSYRDKVMIWL